jgi:lipoprotein-releasing system ATP-binding protein
MSEFVKLKMAQYGSPREGEALAEPLGYGPVIETVRNDIPAGGPHFAVNAAVSTTVRGASATVLAAAPAHDFSLTSSPSSAPEQRNVEPAQLSAVGIKKIYRKGPVEIPVLGGVDLEVRRGEFLTVIGQSGCGKSTLLHLLGTLDAPNSGEVHYNGARIDNLPAQQRDALRNTQFGMIFQFYHLLPELTTLENVLAPLMIRFGSWRYWRRRRALVDRAKQLLEMVGLAHRLKHKPRELSGGEMQRTAIARALVAGPQILLADEPTGNLDQTTGEEILRILRTLNRDEKLSIVMVTHDSAIAAGADRVVRLAGGLVANV